MVDRHTTPPIVDAILHQAEDIFHRTGRPPATIRCHPSVRSELYRAAVEQGFGSPFTRDVVIAGMRVDDDPYLPNRVWRLCDEFETLLYDCREGTPAL